MLQKNDFLNLMLDGKVKNKKISKEDFLNYVNSLFLKYNDDENRINILLSILSNTSVQGYMSTNNKFQLISFVKDENYYAKYKKHTLYIYHAISSESIEFSFNDNEYDDFKKTVLELKEKNNYPDFLEREKLTETPLYFQTFKSKNFVEQKAQDSMIVCSYCKKTIPISMKYCTYCGKKVFSENSVQGINNSDTGISFEQYDQSINYLRQSKNKPNQNIEKPKKNNLALSKVIKIILIIAFIIFILGLVIFGVKSLIKNIDFKGTKPSYSYSSSDTSKDSEVDSNNAVIIDSDTDLESSSEDNSNISSNTDTEAMSTDVETDISSKDENDKDSSSKDNSSTEAIDSNNNSKPDKNTTVPYHKQKLIVESYDVSYANIKLVEWKGNKWETLYSFKGRIGRDGVSEKCSEGDSYTPKGTFDILFAISADDMNTGLDEYIVDRNTVWVNDTKSKFYNTIRNEATSKRDWMSCEYIYSQFTSGHSVAGITFAFNGDCKSEGSADPTKGSTLFIDGRINNFNATFGDIAILNRDMTKILALLDKDLHPVVVIK